MPALPPISMAALAQSRDVAFTLVVCHLNRVAEIDRIALAARAALASFPRGRLLIVDNGSTDGAVERLAQIHAAYPDIGFVVEPRRGIYYARRCGLITATGDHVLFLDDDATIDAAAIAGLLAPLILAPDIGVVGARVNLGWTRPKPDWLHPRLLNQFAVETEYLPPGYQFAEFPNLPTGVAIAVRLGPWTALYAGEPRGTSYPLGRRSAFDGEAIPAQAEGGEDSDLCQVFRANGMSVLFANHIRVWLEVPEDRLTPDWFLTRYRTEGRTRIRLLRLTKQSPLGPHGVKFLAALPFLFFAMPLARLFGPQYGLLAAAYFQKSLGAWDEWLRGRRHAPWPYRL